MLFIPKIFVSGLFATMFLLLAGLPAGIIAAVGNDGSNPFWHGGAGFFETQRIYNDARFPNLVTAMDGSIVATWSRDSAYLVRRSVDAGRSWGPITTISQMGWWERGYPGPRCARWRYHRG